MRACAAAHGVDHREADGDDERLEHAEDDDAARRDGGDRHLDAVDRGERAPGRRVDQADRGEDDHRAEHRLRQVLHRLGEEEQDRARPSPAATRPGDLAARAHRVVDRGARAARADREALREPGRGVRGAHREQLLRAADVLVVLPGERARGEDLVGEARRGRCPSAAGTRRTMSASAGVGTVEARQARRESRPTTATPCAARSSAHESDDRRDDDDQRRRQPAARSAAARTAPPSDDRRDARPSRR